MVSADIKGVWRSYYFEAQWVNMLMLLNRVQWLSMQHMQGSDPTTFSLYLCGFTLVTPTDQHIFVAQRVRMSVNGCILIWFFFFFWSAPQRDSLNPKIPRWRAGRPSCRPSGTSWRCSLALPPWARSLASSLPSYAFTMTVTRGGSARPRLRTRAAESVLGGGRCVAQQVRLLCMCSEGSWFKS